MAALVSRSLTEGPPLSPLRSAEPNARPLGMARSGYKMMESLEWTQQKLTRER